MKEDEKTTEKFYCVNCKSFKLQLLEVSYNREQITIHSVCRKCGFASEINFPLISVNFDVKKFQKIKMEKEK